MEDMVDGALGVGGTEPEKDEQRVMPAPALNPEDCKRIYLAEGELLPCPFCGHEAQMWQYEVNGNYLKGACCSNEDCPLDNPGRSFEAATKREARCLWNKRA
jgi:hypothetical protein